MVDEQADSSVEVKERELNLTLEEVAHFDWMAKKLNLHNPDSQDEIATFAWKRDDSTRKHPAIVPLKVLQWANQSEYDFEIAEFKAKVTESLPAFKAFLQANGYKDFEHALSAYTAAIDALEAPSEEALNIWKEEQEKNYLGANLKWNTVANYLMEIEDADFNEILSRISDFTNNHSSLEENLKSKLVAISSRPFRRMLVEIYHGWRTYKFRDTLSEPPEKFQKYDPMRREESVNKQIRKYNLKVFPDIELNSEAEVQVFMKQARGSVDGNEEEGLNSLINKLIQKQREALETNSEISSEDAYLQIYALAKKLMSYSDDYLSENPMVRKMPEKLKATFGVLNSNARELLDNLDYDINLAVLEHVKRVRESRKLTE